MCAGRGQDEHSGHHGKRGSPRKEGDSPKNGSIRAEERGSEMPKVTPGRVEVTEGKEPGTEDIFEKKHWLRTPQTWGKT